MAEEKKDLEHKEQPSREAGAEGGQQPAPNADQSREGMPGYGQPPDDVRKPLPEQKW
jgi:hypothetical protein